MTINGGQDGGGAALGAGMYTEPTIVSDMIVPCIGLFTDLWGP